MSSKSKWKKQRVGVLGAKSQMTKHQAEDALGKVIAQKTGGTTDRGGREKDTGLDLRGAHGVAGDGWFVKLSNKFGTVWHGWDFRRLASDRIKTSGRLTQR
jgi:hypothetical protein